jgi:integrase
VTPVECSIVPAITRDNIHLSEPIPQPPESASAAVCMRAPVQSCRDRKILEFIAAATAETTLRAYQADLAHFLAWGGSVPAGSEQVARYLADHADSLSIATLARRVVAIRRAHALQGFVDPTKAELIRLALRGIRRLHGRPQRRASPIRVEHLSAIVACLNTSIREARDRALLLIGFAGAFRRSELIAIDCKWLARAEKGIEITLPRSKTDQEGRGRIVAVPRVNGPLCPVDALDAWLGASTITEGPVFRPVSKAGRVLPSRLSASAVSIIVKQHVIEIGLDPTSYSGHSLRAGFATSAAAAGLSAWDIKRQTGHVSDAVLDRYIREIDQCRHMVAIWPKHRSAPPPST